MYSILDFLQASMDDGSIKQDDKEGIEVASAWMPTVNDLNTKYLIADHLLSTLVWNPL